MDENKDRKHQYEDNFLTDVILRIDFEDIGLTDDKVEKIKNKFSDIFPILQKLSTKKINFSFKDNSPQTNEQDEITYKFVDKDLNTEKIFELDNTHFAYIDKKYYSHSSFKEVSKDIIDFFDANYKDIKIKRIGFRYINQIKIEEKDPYSLDGYINENLTSILKVSPDGKKIIRSMNSTEYRIDDDVRLIFKYGLFNENYPAEPLLKEFVLDYDCYSLFIDKLDDVIEFVDKCNKIMAKYFEGSIGNILRTEILHEKG